MKEVFCFSHKSKFNTVLSREVEGLARWNPTTSIREIHGVKSCGIATR